MALHLGRSVTALLVGVLSLLLPSRADAMFEVVSGSYRTDDRTIVAGAQGATLRYSSGLVMELAPDTRLRQHKDADLWMASGGKTPTEIFSLAAGRVRVQRPLREGKRDVGVLVRTSRKLMGVTANGEFLAIADENDGIVAGYQGTTLLGTGSAWQKLPSGQYGKMSKGAAKIVVVDLPKAPAIQVSKRLWMSLQEQSAIDGVTWTKAAADAQFRLSVHRVDTDEAVAAETLPGTTVPAGKLRLGPGKYGVRVQAINSYGLMGPYSESAQIRVVGVHTHRGVRVDSRGTVHLAANQRAEFLNVEGLLMAYGNTNRWAPATSSVPLHDQDPVFVHFREPNSADVVSARLEPRGVVAEVYVGSKLAQWPGDAVEVVVRLRDESGEVSGDAITPHFEVTLGIMPLSLVWERKGSTWRASIPPQAGPGPWVVRASVTDEHGVELGRDFLEVAERPSGQSKSTTPPRTPENPVARPVAHAR